MSTQAFTAHVIGIPHIPTITEVNVRNGAGTNHDMIFRLRVGLDGLPIEKVEIDNQGRNLRGKIYQWFRVATPFGQGWIRGDLIEVRGDGRRYGYPMVTMPTLAFNLTRQDIEPIVEREEGRRGTMIRVPQPVGEREPEVVRVPEVEPRIPEPPPVSTTVVVPEGIGRAICQGLTGVNMRSGAGTNHPVVDRFKYRDSADIVESAPGQDGKEFLWLKVKYRGREAWVREDFLRYTGNFGRIGLSNIDMYPSPVPEAWWVRDYDADGRRIGTRHAGWDLGGKKGLPVLAGPKGGKVILSAFCSRCGFQGLSTLEKGFSLGDSRIFRDQGWNFGYGHYLMVRYLHDDLPETTQQEFARKGFGGAHAFVVYAHLQDLLVPNGMDLEPNQQIATLGNSGNSSGPHLHLEVRAHRDANEKSWARMIGGLMSPGVLFLR